MIAALSVLACAARRPPEASLGPEGRWEVAVLAATGSREIEAHYHLATERLKKDRFRISTERTTGSWIEPGDSASFDSASPTGSDPWPLTLQHLVASVPADLQIEDGRPVALLDEATWRDSARRAIYGSSLPAEALPAGEALVDGSGLVADLARTFPGTPPEGPWERRERIAGVDAILTEQCEGGEPGPPPERKTRWSCAGSARAAEGESAELFEVRTWTEVETDRVGLRSVETGYSGTLVTLSSGGTAADDRPITGFRRVVRR